MKNKKSIIGALILYVISTAGAYATFSFLNSEPDTVVTPLAKNNDGTLAIDPGAPRTEVCPLNGKLYTEVERESWEKRRPLVVMVENSPDARPHSGIVRADVVYEAVAEGGVTRFMPVFYCDAQASNVVVAPVRSVRTYFIDWASEYGETPLFGHVGGANCSAEKLPSGGSGPCKTDKRAQAIEQLVSYGWRYAQGNDLDQFSVGAPTYIRNENRLGHTVATEHSVEGNTEKLWEVGKKRGWTNLDPDGVEWSESFKPWKFKKEEPAAADRGTVKAISHDFWDGYKQFDVRWEYNPETNEYLRFTGGEPHLDLETKQQLSAKNVIVQLTKEIGPVDDLKHMLYTTIGEGDAYIFMDGQVIEGRWEKDSRTGRTIFTNKKNQEIEFTPGRVWISVVSDDTNVTY